MEGSGIAYCGNAEEARLALLTQSLECRHDFVQDDPGGQIAVAAFFGNMVVQLEEIDLLELEPLQARLQPCRHRPRDMIPLPRRYSHLRPAPHIRSPALPSP